MLVLVISYNLIDDCFRVVHFEMEQYGAAKASFSQGMKLRQEQSSNRDTAPYARFIRKCNAEMAGSESYS